MWLVERTYSDDEQNLIILIYATTDGEHYYRKERALTTRSDVRETTAAVVVDESNVGTVNGPSSRNGTRPKQHGWRPITTRTTRCSCVIRSGRLLFVTERSSQASTPCPRYSSRRFP